jgi:flavin reductase (DIM6/NTAB) family NADH-FMN oxidoreductase RutF
MHQVISPAIFYWGTPIVLVTSLNEDGTTNIAPMSSAWWLGNRCMLGLAAGSQTSINIMRDQQCVLNLASDDMQDPINALARTTGTPNVEEAKPDSGIPYFKKMAGYKSVHDKFSHTGFTPQPAEIVRPHRIAECAAQMEAELVGIHEMFQGEEDVVKGVRGVIVALEVKVLRTHVHERIRMAGHENRIDPDQWNPMIMSFQELYGIKREKVAPSVLARIGEESYRGMSNAIPPFDAAD